jgi:hypothetical protein
LAGDTNSLRIALWHDKNFCHPGCNTLSLLASY